MPGHLTTRVIELCDEALPTLQPGEGRHLVERIRATLDEPLRVAVPQLHRLPRPRRRAGRDPGRTPRPVGELDGHRASVSNTVSGAGVISVDTKVLAFVGDFSAIRWGVQKSIGLEVIKYGDPDGGGDLKRKNQVAFRAEVVYGWGIADLNAFAKIHDLA